MSPMKLGVGVGLTQGAGTRYIPDRPYPSYPSTVMFDLTRKAQVSGAPASITDVTMDGRDAIRVLIPTADVVLVPGTLATPVNMSAGGSVRIAFKPIANFHPASAAITRFVLELFSDANVATTNFISTLQFGISSDVRQRSTQSSALVAGREQFYSAALPQYNFTNGTGCDLTQARGRIRLRDAANQVILEGFKMEFVPNPRSNGVLLITGDDLYASHDSYVRPLVEAAGGRMTFYGGAYQAFVNQPGRMTEAQLIAAHASGHQIAGQAWSSEDPTGHDVTWLNAELAAMKNYIRNTVLAQDDAMDGSYFSTVTQTNLPFFPAFPANHRTVRTHYLGSGTGVPLIVGETSPVGDPMAIRASAIYTTATASSQMLAGLDQAFANKAPYIIDIHDECASAGNARTGLEATIADAVSKGMPIITMSQFLYG